MAGEHTRWTAALNRLATLPVKGRAPRTGYDRDQFGQSWSDDVNVDGGRNGCDTRNDILRRDLRDVTVRAGTNGCVVLTGTLADPYTGRTITFTRGQGTSELVQIDHVVALSDAWQKGAQQLSAERRRDFANDPRNLLAVDGAANQQKSDSDAASWLPANRSFRCAYVAIQVEVKATYGLWVTSTERDAITRVLANCGGAAPATAPATTPRVTTPPPPPPVYYANCAAARAAGAAPVNRGEPGYAAHLDADGDGVGCEPAPAYVPPPAPVTAPFKNCAAARAAGAAPVHRGEPGYGPHLDRDNDGIGCE